MGLVSWRRVFLLYSLCVSEVLNSETQNLLHKIFYVCLCIDFDPIWEWSLAVEGDASPDHDRKEMVPSRNIVDFLRRHLWFDLFCFIFKTKFCYTSDVSNLQFKFHIHPTTRAREEANQKHFPGSDEIFLRLEYFVVHSYWLAAIENIDLSDAASCLTVKQYKKVVWQDPGVSQSDCYWSLRKLHSVVARL